jgi:transcriptional regulator with XRE-family HTH domain
MDLSIIVDLNKDAIGIVIRQLRLKKGLSQEVLSGFAGLARSHLAMIETGDKIPNFETIWRIANALELQAHELVALIEEESHQMSKKK